MKKTPAKPAAIDEKKPRARRSDAKPEQPPRKPAPKQHPVGTLVDLAALDETLRQLCLQNMSLATTLKNIDVTLDKICGKYLEPPAAKAPRALKSAPVETRCPACSSLLGPENSSKLPSGEIVHINCSEAKLPAAKPEPKKDEPKPAGPPTVESIRVASLAYAQKNGRDALAALLTAAGYARISDIPEQDRAAALEALNA